MREVRSWAWLGAEVSSRMARLIALLVEEGLIYVPEREFKRRAVGLRIKTLNPGMSLGFYYFHSVPLVAAAD